MKKITFLLVSGLAFAACSDKKTTEVTTPKDPCVTPSGNYLKANIQHGSGAVDAWCANTSLFADKGTVMTINGMNKIGTNLTLELDNFDPGTYAITNDSNHVFLSDMNGGFESTNGDPGTLVITKFDDVKNILEGTYSVKLTGPGIGTATISNGTFKVHFTE